MVVHSAVLTLADVIANSLLSAPYTAMVLLQLDYVIGENNYYAVPVLQNIETFGPDDVHIQFRKVFILFVVLFSISC